MKELPAAIVIFGPTASGKTALALEMAEKLGGEVVNADSRQIYKGMPIISACPNAAEYARVPHHLFEFINPDVRYSAGEYARAAAQAMGEIAGRKRIPVVVGGTGLYLRALTEGMSVIPEVGEGIRDAVELRVRGDVAGAYAELEKIDAAWAAKVMPSDAQRIARGLSVWEATGVRLSEWQGRKGGGGAPFRFFKVGILPERDVLVERLHLRWKHMVDVGVVDEVRALLAAGYTPELGSMKGLGIPEMVEFVHGRLAWNDAEAAALASLRQYAKRQVTWLKNQYNADLTLGLGEGAKAVSCFTDAYL